MARSEDEEPMGEAGGGALAGWSVAERVGGGW